jgi:hypothetical protein
MLRVMTAGLALVMAVLPSAGAAQDMMTLQAAGPAAELVYPEATIVANGAVGELRQLALTTPDPPDKVLSFYEAQFGESLSATCLHGGDGMLTASIDDSRSPDQEGLVVRVLTQVTDDHVVMVTMTRAARESLTHIVLLHLEQ